MLAHKDGCTVACSRATCLRHTLCCDREAKSVQALVLHAAQPTSCRAERPPVSMLHPANASAKESQRKTSTHVRDRW